MALRAASRLTDHPVRELWLRHRPSLIRGFCLIAAGSSAFNIFIVYLPNSLITRGRTEMGPTLLVTAAALGVAAVAALVLGRTSDRVGRRPVVLGSIGALLVLVVPMSMVGSSVELVGLFVAELTIGLAVAGVLSIAMLGELFPASLRSTGFALSAGLSTALVGGTAPLIGQLLVDRTGVQAAPGIYVALLAIVALIAVWGWPETAFSDLDGSTDQPTPPGELPEAAGAPGGLAGNSRRTSSSSTPARRKASSKPCRAAGSASLAHRTVQVDLPTVRTPSKLSSTSRGTSPATRISKVAVDISHLIPLRGT
jgi:MFS family permease